VGRSSRLKSKNIFEVHQILLADVRNLHTGEHETRRRSAAGQGLRVPVLSWALPKITGAVQGIINPVADTLLTPIDQARGVPVEGQPPPRSRLCVGGATVSDEPFSQRFSSQITTPHTGVWISECRQVEEYRVSPLPKMASVRVGKSGGRFGFRARCWRGIQSPRLNK